MPGAAHSEQVTFRVQQEQMQNDKKVLREKIMKGVLSNFSATWVRPKLRIASLQCSAKAIDKTAVILLTTRKAAVNADSWADTHI